MYGILIQNFSGYNNEDLKNSPPPRVDKELEQPDEAAIPSHQQRPVIPDFRENHPSSKQIGQYTPNIVNHSAIAVDDS